MFPTETVTIDKLVYEGHGLSRLGSGELVFVPFTAPGDAVSIRLAERRKKVCFGEVVEIANPAAERVKPPCSVFGTCGGCHWQHLSQPAQLDWKQRIVSESLERIGKFNNVKVSPCIAANTWHYRNKVEWVVDTRVLPARIGYLRYRSHEMVPFEHCWIIPERWTALAHWLAENLPQGLAVRHIQVKSNRQDNILLSFMGEELASGLSPLIAKLTAAFSEIIGVMIQESGRWTALFGESSMTETLGAHRYIITPGSFFQVNPPVAEQLLALLSEVAVHSSSLIDLYAGSGLFSIHLNEGYSRILAIESSSEAVRNGKANLEMNNISHIQFQQGDAVKTLSTLAETFDSAILDPPRTGCEADVMDWLATHIQQQIIYVSCNPTTLARDLQKLTAQGWKIDRVQPFDMFPQTYHVETVVLLSPADKAPG